MSTNDPARPLREFSPAHPFFVGLDSDGCVFDTMAIKHQQCFAPLFVEHFGLQEVAEAASAVWDFVNLRSKTRGINRYPALSNALYLLAEHPEVQARGVAVPGTDELDVWMAGETQHTLDTLRTEVEQRGNTALRPVLDWSLAVDARIAEVVRGIPPFPGVREALERLAGHADAMVVSQTPGEALQREWAGPGLDRLVTLIAGQEMGSKRDHLRLATVAKYPPNHVLMIGDAPGDFIAARTNHALFFPIIPGSEAFSWRRLLDESLDAFFGETYAGDYEAALVREFQVGLPERPSW